MKNVTEPLKNTVVEKEVQKNTFRTFLSHFNMIQKIDKEFYSWDDRRVDYNSIVDEAKRANISEIPSKEELQKIV